MKKIIFSIGIGFVGSLIYKAALPSKIYKNLKTDKYITGIIMTSISGYPLSKYAEKIHLQKNPFFYGWVAGSFVKDGGGE